MFDVRVVNPPNTKLDPCRTLADKTEFPFFFRAALTKGATYETVAQYLKHHGWRQAVYLNGGTVDNVDLTTDYFKTVTTDEGGVEPVVITFHTQKAVDCGDLGTITFHPRCAASREVIQKYEGCDLPEGKRDLGFVPCASAAEGVEAYTAGLSATMRAVRATGIRVVVFNMFVSTGEKVFNEVYDEVKRLGMLEDHVWMSTDDSSLLLEPKWSKWRTHPGFVGVLSNVADEAAEGGGATVNDRAAFDAKWSKHATNYAPRMAHSPWNAYRGSPLYTDHISASASNVNVWDANGNSAMDNDYGLFSYDTVWIYARAINTLVKQGVSPYDGVALRSVLRGDLTDPLVSGTPYSFHPRYQDRMKPAILFEVQPDASTYSKVFDL